MWGHSWASGAGTIPERAGAREKQEFSAQGTSAAPSPALIPQTGVPVLLSQWGETGHRSCSSASSGEQGPLLLPWGGWGGSGDIRSSLTPSCWPWGHQEQPDLLMLALGWLWGGSGDSSSSTKAPDPDTTAGPCRVCAPSAPALIHLLCHPPGLGLCWPPLRAELG